MSIAQRMVLEALDTEKNEQAFGHGLSALSSLLTGDAFTSCLHIAAAECAAAAPVGAPTCNVWTMIANTFAAQLAN